MQDERDDQSAIPAKRTWRPFRQALRTKRRLIIAERGQQPAICTVPWIEYLALATRGLTDISYNDRIANVQSS